MGGKGRMKGFRFRSLKGTSYLQISDRDGFLILQVLCC